MKLKIKEIGPSGRDVCWDLSTADVREMLRRLDVDVVGDSAEAHLALHLTRVEEKVVGRGKMDGAFEVPCVRCLAPASVALSEPDVMVTFVPVSEEDIDAQLAIEDASSFSFDGEEVDLEPVLREALVLAIPIAPVCNDDCRGICSGCGSDLNHETCDCKEPSTTTSWKAALERLRESS